MAGFCFYAPPARSDIVMLFAEGVYLLKEISRREFLQRIGHRSKRPAAVLLALVVVSIIRFFASQMLRGNWKFLVGLILLWFLLWFVPWLSEKLFQRFPPPVQGGLSSMGEGLGMVCFAGLAILAWRSAEQEDLANAIGFSGLIAYFVVERMSTAYCTIIAGVSNTRDPGSTL